MSSLHLLLLLSLHLTLPIFSHALNPHSFLLHAAERDALRHRRVACETRRASHNITHSSNQSFSTPLISGAYAGAGQYFARFLVGTPAQRFLLILDTGSDLTWVKCRRDDNASTHVGSGRIFKPTNSTTFKQISCSSSLCKSSLTFSLTNCSTPTSPCLYDYLYSDGSHAQGLFANESATIRLSSGRREKLPGIVVGCTSGSTGTTVQKADGVLGLSYSATSFASTATARFGGKFAYCLVDHLAPKNTTGFLSFGGSEPPVHLRYAALVQVEPFYAVQVKGLSLDGELLNISGDVWNASAGGGVIVDTGTSLAVLAHPAYVAVTAALSRALVGYPRVDVKPFEYCYNWTAVGGFDERSVPRLAVHMAAHGGGGEVRLKPPVKSYVVDVADGVKCIGAVSAAWPGASTIGNILQQGHYWEVDLARGRLGFGGSDC